MASPAQRHMMRVSAQEAAQRENSALRHASGYELMLMRLAGDNVLAITTIYLTKAQAMRAAQSKWDKLQRGVAEFSINLAMGRADLYPETPVTVKGFKAVIDQQAWTITKVTHTLGDGGYTTALELDVKLSNVEYEEV